MASNTENLGLLKKNPSTDGADTFNIQTMLNDNWDKIDNNAGTVAQTLANILKPTTPPLIGLPPSTTPDGMFQALGNTGELHVWRKTVVTKDPVPEVPGSYTLGDAQRLYVATRTFANSSYESYIEGVLASNAITIDLDGKVTLTDPAEVTLYIYNRRDGVTSQTGREAISGYSYFLIPSTSASFIGCEISMTKDTIYYIPSSSSYHRTSSSSGGQSSFDAAQLVTGVPGTPAIPAGTTTTYPVSTNPKAYQEGDDAKAAGYVVGEVVTKQMALSSLKASTDGINWKYGDSVVVADDGTVSVYSPNSKAIYGNGSTSAGKDLIGKFAVCLSDGSSFTNGSCYFFPSDATSVWNTSEFDGMPAVQMSKYQPVTGYAAIPAGTTIEYLGKLGDKARVQVVSYVGTGTNGPDNPCSITANFKIKVAVMLGSNQAGSDIVDYFSYNYRRVVVLANLLSTEYKDSFGFGYWSSNSSDYYRHSKISADRKTLSWYWDQKGTPERQYNVSGKTYYVLIIG